MATNLIEQQNRLKGLSDEQLQGEGNAPSGQVPPFLVMTELNRRKTMRDAYTAQQARRKPTSTVAQDLLSAPIGMTPGPAAMGGGAPGSGGEIGIAAALDPGASNLPADDFAYAEGGLVDDSTMARILKRREAALTSVDDDREKVRARTLIAAGASMMGNGSANFMKNIGAGLTGGLDAWQAQTTMLDSREGAALEGMMGVDAADRADRLAAMDESFRRDQEARLTSQANAQLNAPTADMQNYSFFDGLDTEGKADYMRVNGSGQAATGDATTRRYAMNAYAEIREKQRKAVASSYENELKWATPEEKAGIAAKVDAEAITRANAEFEAAYPDWATLMPELTAGAPGGTAAAPEKDPLGLGI